MIGRNDANEFIEEQLQDRVRALGQVFGADVISYSGDLLDGVDDAIRNVVETKASSSGCEKLVVVLTTSGGYIETVARIVDTLRHHYCTVEFVIPNRAFSAGTVLALSGNAIHMDYYSRLGPIDPQVDSKTGEQVPALGYLVRYDELLQKAAQGEISAHEAALLLNFDQAELYMFEHARELSVSLLKEWLVAYKFRDWTRTGDRGLEVTLEMRTERAEQIARLLNDTDRWHSHGYGISMEVLRTDLKLRIDDFGKNKSMSDAIRNYHELLQDYLSKRGIIMAIHAEGIFSTLATRHHH